MFGRSTKTEVDSLIGMAARIEGDLCFTGGVRIDGEVHGNVFGGDSPDSVLVISEHARIEGDVHCATIVVNGNITGNVFATELLELQPKARIMGDVHYKTLEMQSGAMVTGKLTHQPPGEPVFHLAGQEPPQPEAQVAPTVYNGPNRYPSRSSK
ncbi:MAG: polymer-forming cytoskeletal protein [Gammaproteobacteria bacterium]